MFDDHENESWVEEMVKRQSRAGAGFSKTPHGIYRRSDGLAQAYWAGVIDRRQMEAGRRYERDYDALHRSGKYRCTIYRFIEEDGSEEESERTLTAAMNLRRAREVLTPRQRALCDTACGHCLVTDEELAVALGRLFEHYSCDAFGLPERINLCVYKPRIKTEEEKRAGRIREALRRLSRPLEPVMVKPKGPAFRLVAEDPEPELEWEDFLPEKPSRDDASMPQAWLRETGVLRANRDTRHLGVQAKGELKAKKRAKGVVRKRVRRKGNS